MTCKELRSVLYADYQRVKQIGGGDFASIFLKYIEFRLIFWTRFATYLSTKHNVFIRFVWLIVLIIHKHLEHKTGITLSPYTNIGKGFRIAHLGSIVVVGSAEIGENCTLHQNVTLGRSFSGSKAGVPTLGNNVIVFPGSAIIGNVHIGDNAIIGANSLVINDVPANAVVGGNPAKILSNDSSHVIGEGWRKYFYLD